MKGALGRNTKWAPSQRMGMCHNGTQKIGFRVPRFPLRSKGCPTTQVNPRPWKPAEGFERAETSFTWILNFTVLGMCLGCLVVWFCSCLVGGGKKHSLLRTCQELGLAEASSAMFVSPQTVSMEPECKSRTHVLNWWPTYVSRL